MFDDIKIIKEAVNNLCKLPTIGEKTALRLALYIISADEKYAVELSDSIRQLRADISFCKICNSLTENKDLICNICKDSERDGSTICVVEQPQDVLIIEKNNIYNGRYFVLKGVIDPLNGIEPEDIELKKLFLLIKNNSNVKEIIIATNPTLKGETTANYIEEELKGIKIKISRIAYGMPVGASIDYADSVTLKKSFDGRTMLNKFEE